MVWASVAVALCFSALFTYYATTRKRRATTNIAELGGFFVLVLWQFFNRRSDFLRSNFKKTGEKLFRFRVLQHHVVAMHGADARMIFFQSKSLNFDEGYQVFMGGPAGMADPNLKTAESNKQFFLKIMSDLFTKDRLAVVVPSLLRDTTRLMACWVSEGTINPFNELNSIVFQLTVRMSSCHELAEDRKAVARMEELLYATEKHSTAASLLLPWFPSSAKRSRQRASDELRAIIGSYVEERRVAMVPTNDPVDYIFGTGCEPQSVIDIVLGLIFAGYINTGMNVCWDLLYLGMHPEWKAKVATEIQLLISNHTNTISNEPLHERLASIPLEAWETELPVLDSIIRETQRMTLGQSLLRRNRGDEIFLGDKVIPMGDFLIYPLHDVHADPEIYSEPSKFDPQRFGPGREEDKKAPLAFLGWGAGRHMCAGMRIAKLEVKLVIAVFFSTFEFEIVDSSGELPKSFPRPDFNDYHRASPSRDNPCYIKFRRISP
ncbi:cytochrome P450 [Mycena latifolia]|nr:cytochrome P450 [Mycena latifolia]